MTDCVKSSYSLDHKNLFGPVVLLAEVPDYYDVVKQPMFWSTIDTRLEEHYYESAAEFQVGPDHLPSEHD